MATKQEVFDILTMAAAAYPGLELKPDTVRVYALTLEDVPAALLRAAALQHVATAKFFPTVAELREAALDLTELEGFREDAYTAWGRVLEAVRRFGINRPPRPAGHQARDGEPGWRFANPFTAQAVEAIGWRTICLSDETDLSVRARFIAAYEACEQRARTAARLLPAVREEIRRHLAERQAREALPAGGSAPVPLRQILAGLAAAGDEEHAASYPIRAPHPAEGVTR